MGVMAVVLCLVTLISGVSGLLPGLYCGDQNCYDVLNVTREVEKTELTKAYRSAARKWHPDRHQGKEPLLTLEPNGEQHSIEAKKEAEEKFQVIATAYETLKDDEVRQEYDYLLDNPDEVYRHYWYYYKRKAAPKVDLRLVILATIFIISAIQYLSAVQKYREAIGYALSHPKYRHQASQIAKDRGLLGEARKKENRKLKKTKDEIKADEELILKAIIEENIDVKGGYKHPSLSNTLLVWIAFSPYYIYGYIVFTAKWIWRFWIKKEEYGDEEKLYLIRKNLKLSQDLFDAMEEGEKDRMMREELWQRDKFAVWKEAKEEEERRKAAESGRAKSMRRYLKNNKNQMSFVDDDF